MYYDIFDYSGGGNNFRIKREKILFLSGWIMVMIEFV